MRNHLYGIFTFHQKREKLRKAYICDIMADLNKMWHDDAEL